jgi:hypothetical protein
VFSLWHFSEPWLSSRSCPPAKSRVFVCRSYGPGYMLRRFCQWDCSIDITGMSNTTRINGIFWEAWHFPRCCFCGILASHGLALGHVPRQKVAFLSVIPGSLSMCYVDFACGVARSISLACLLRLGSMAYFRKPGIFPRCFFCGIFASPGPLRSGPNHLSRHVRHTQFGLILLG